MWTTRSPKILLHTAAAPSDYLTDLSFTNLTHPGDRPAWRSLARGEVVRYIDARSSSAVDTAHAAPCMENFALTWRLVRFGVKGDFTMGFEVFDKRAAPLAKAPSVTIQKRGIISMNNAAHRLIGEAESVELLFDRDSEVIALRPSSEPHAYTLRQQAARSSGQAVVSATAFTQYFDIDTSVSRRFKPFERDGMLCIDLRSEAITVVGNRTKQEEHDEGS